jgi:hypothetical protein
MGELLCPSGHVLALHPSGVALGRAIVRCWCAHELVDRAFGLWMEPTPLHASHLLLITLTAAFPRRPLLMLALAVRLTETFLRIPFVWDCDHWTQLMDSGMLVLCLLASLRGLLGRTSPVGNEVGPVVAQAWALTSRWQLVFFYFAAAFWKINSSFFDPTTSCAPMFVLVLLSAFGVPVPDLLLPSVARSAAFITIAGEMAISLLLASRSLLFRRFAVALAVLLHAGIALTPPPNNAVPFSVACAVRLMMTMPRGLAALAEETSNGGFKPALTAALAAAAAAAGSAFAHNRALRHPPIPGAPVDFPIWVAAYCFLGIYALRVAMLEPPSAESDTPSAGGVRTVNTTTTPAADSAPAAPPAPSGFELRAVRFFFVSLAFTYSFVLPPLGLHDQGAPNMYSNLRMHGGSNHYLVPYLDLIRFAMPKEDARGAFATVRVEEVSSEWINSIYPGELTLSMSADERALLARANHTARMFNAMKARVLGTWVVPPPPEGPPVRYSLPALELRRILAEARELNESFYMRYTELPGMEGDEAWRREGEGRGVLLRESGDGKRECKLEAGGECTKDELANLPPPPWYARKWLVQQPYPILEGDRRIEITCFGP